jgi:hypothetical protein
MVYAYSYQIPISPMEAIMATRKPRSQPKTSSPTTLNETQLDELTNRLMQRIQPALSQIVEGRIAVSQRASATTTEDSPRGEPTTTEIAPNVRQTQNSPSSTSNGVVTIDAEKLAALESEYAQLTTALDAIRTNLATNPPGYVLLIYDPIRPNDPQLFSSMDYLYAGAILLQMFDRAYPSVGMAQTADFLMQQYSASRQANG